MSATRTTQLTQVFTNFELVNLFIIDEIHDNISQPRACHFLRLVLGDTRLALLAFVAFTALQLFVDVVSIFDVTFAIRTVWGKRITFRLCQQANPQ